MAEFLPLVEWFKRAAVNLKYPAVRLSGPDGLPLSVRISGARSRRPGSLAVTNGGPYGQSRWYGYVGVDGSWHPAVGHYAAPGWVENMLRAFTADPAGVAAAHGKLTGKCSFCRRELSDPRSVHVGYGEVCAGHYGLPWGHGPALPSGASALNGGAPGASPAPVPAPAPAAPAVDWAGTPNPVPAPALEVEDDIPLEEPAAPDLSGIFDGASGSSEFSFGGFINTKPGAKSRPAPARPVVEVAPVAPAPVFPAPAVEDDAKMAEVLDLLRGDCPVLLVGPTGSGKTTLAYRVAERLGLEAFLVSFSGGTTESMLFGTREPGENGAFEHVSTPFVRGFEGPGLVILDEVDAADPNVLLSANAPLANGVLPLPKRAHAPVAHRHPQSRFIACANTMGSGATRQYVGRNQLDAASLDRFLMGMVEIDYDVELEKRLLSCDRALCARLHDLRRRAADAGLRRWVSTRFIAMAARMRAVGWSADRIMRKATLTWTPDERARCGVEV